MNIKKYLNDMYEDEKKLYNFYKSNERKLVVTSNDEFTAHFNKWNYFDMEKSFVENDDYISNLKIGNFFLYESFEVRDEHYVCYPKLGILLNQIPLEQTIQLECFDVRRNWEQNKYIDGQCLANRNSVINTYIQWIDYTLIYGIFNKYPSWQELKKHYKRTWFYQKSISEIRQERIRYLLKK